MLDYIEYEDFRAEVRAKVDEIVAPHAAAVDDADHIPNDVMKAVGELGWFGATAPVEYGGLGWDTVRYAVLVEEV